MTLSFAGLELDQDLFELRRLGRTIPIQRKAFDVLLYVCEHRHRVVTKDELLAAIWPDCCVGDGALSQVIKTIRRVLVENSAPADTLVTVRGRGFRFNGDIASVVRHHRKRTHTTRVVPQIATTSAIFRSLGNLPANALAQLEVATMVGREFSLDDLTLGVAADYAECLARLGQAELDGLVQRIPGNPARFRFSRARVRQILYASLSTDRKIEIREALSGEPLRPHRRERVVVR
jgi:DNA-binding winged helix-turn-helix (wHTH) protein